MDTPIVTTPTGVADPGDRQALCATCHAICDRLARVRTHRWILNAETDTLTGVMQWTEYEAIAMGTEASRMEVAWLHGARRILRCRDIPCLGDPHKIPTRDGDNQRPNADSVRHRPHDDPRG